MIAISGGVIGGTFAPSLFIGTALGAPIGHGVHAFFPLMQEPQLIAAASGHVIDVVQRMHSRGVDRCPAIDSGATRRVVGFLSPSDILRIRIRRGATAPDEAFEIFR